MRLQEQNTEDKYKILTTQFLFIQLCQLTMVSRKVILEKTVFSMRVVAFPLTGRPRCIREHEQTARADK